MATTSLRLIGGLGDARVAKYLKVLLARADVCWMAVAYGSYAAFARLQPAFTDLMLRNGQLRVLFDVQGLATEPKVVEELATIPGDCECKVFVGETGAGAVRAFHSKLYYFETGGDASILVGSSNFTDGGLAANMEANVAIDCPADSVFAGKVRSLWQRAWNSSGSIAPTSAFLDGYKTVVATNRKATGPAERAGTKRLVALAAREQVLAASASSPRLAYLLGLVAGGGRFAEGGSESFAIRNESRERTSAGTERGVISAPGITDYSVSQRDAVRIDAARVVETVDSWLRTTGHGAAELEMHGEYSYSINVRLAHGSPAFLGVEQFVATGAVDRGRFFPQALPTPGGKEMDRGSQLEFVKGYFDIRGRVSVADRLPNNLLRIAVSVSSPRADSFGHELQHAFQEQFGGAEVNYEEGTLRGRESIIRIDARDLPPRLFASPWQSIMHNEFAAHNQRLFPR